jgi:hypothetical protein
MVNDKKIYRKEDIIKMGTQPVNKGWGPKGADTYSIWLYKGGGDCHHRWYRKTYIQKKGDPIPNVEKDEALTTTRTKQLGYVPPTNEKEVPVKPKDMKNRGFLPSNKKR